MGQPVSAVHEFPNALHRQLGEGAPQVVGSYGRADLGSARAINCSKSRALAGSRSRNRVDVAAVAGHRRVRAADQCPADVVGSGGHGAGDFVRKRAVLARPEFWAAINATRCGPNQEIQTADRDNVPVNRS